MMNSQMFFLTLIIIMWDSSRISKKWGFSTDKLMLGTARKHKRKFSLFLDIMKCRQERKNIFHLHLGLIWSSMFHWELGVSFKYGLQVTSTCSQPLNRNKNMPFLTFCTQHPSAMKKVGEVRAETCFTTLAASCQRSKAHIRWLGAESGLCYAVPSQDHPSDLHTPPPATGRWCHLCHSGKTGKIERCDTQLKSDTSRADSRCGPTHNAIACDLEVFLGHRSLMEVTVKVTGCPGRIRKNCINETRITTSKSNVSVNQWRGSLLPCLSKLTLYM